MTQLIQPNLSVVGYPDLCLAYVEQVYGIKNDPDPNAHQGWLDAKIKHPNEQPPADASVPVWFDWTGTIGGITQNWGHVAASTPNGVYTNPLSGSGHKIFASVQALASAYGVQYVGWSEDLGSLIIVEGENHMATENQIKNFYDVLVGRAPTQDEINARLGQNAEAAWDEIRTGAKGTVGGVDWLRDYEKNATQEINDLTKQLASDGTTLAPGKYNVVK